ncbi:MAG: hypothetical protein U9N34_05180, partial [Candidatus Cloacimonadota bacterium]|nr:hypothetical protein [Candidatus Cloacimonadota bacterium]
MLPNANAFGYRNAASTKLKEMTILSLKWNNSNLFQSTNFESEDTFQNYNSRIFSYSKSQRNKIPEFNIQNKQSLILNRTKPQSGENFVAQCVSVGVMKERESSS